mmetsp:Transcript_53834/g.100393  ORF Transcript_53834/g.100393 Transcript_53834/m.100393 type:complete len:185 (+) Transcript_53834:347-901(+)
MPRPNSGGLNCPIGRGRSGGMHEEDEDEEEAMLAAAVAASIEETSTAAINPTVAASELREREVAAARFTGNPTTEVRDANRANALIAAAGSTCAAEASAATREAGGDSSVDDDREILEAVLRMSLVENGEDTALSPPRRSSHRGPASARSRGGGASSGGRFSGQDNRPADEDEAFRRAIEASLR